MLIRILMKRDGLTLEEAKAQVDEAREDLLARLEQGEDVDDADFMSEWFGLEPDYIMELI